jgi:very-short-patch-repair endonuclease
MVRNDDWSYADALEYLGIAGISSKKFFEFLELLVHPVVRPGVEQEQYANTINSHLRRDGLNLCAVDHISGYPVYKVLPLREGVVGTAKNLIFAADGPKPEIVIADAINNDIRIVKNAEYCLVYDAPIPATGLRWADLVRWWAGKNGMDTASIDTERHLYERLRKSLGSSPPELSLFKTYFKEFKRKYGDSLPALIPQVYLHYDPYTARELVQARLPRQRMDFLVLFSGYERVVIEVDGKQHYAVGDKADPKTYAEMVAADRDLRLAGYDVYRFGGHELAAESSVETIADFFERLFAKYRVLPGGVTKLGSE